MAKLKNPLNNLEAIKQDYRDKHAAGGAVLLCRKYDMKLKKDGKPVFDKNGDPMIVKGQWYEAKALTKNETDYVRRSHFPSEKNHNDCYATQNHFPTEFPPEVFDGEKYRTPDNLAYLAGFYIDFDNRKIHDIGKNQQAPSELVEEALGYANYIVVQLHVMLPGDDFGMPVITFTGGGYGFYFPLKPLPATTENKAKYMEVWEKLYRRFSIIFSNILDVFENDHAVLGAERVIRITGTYNSKTGTYARYIARYGGNEYTNEVYRYSLGEISRLYRLDEINMEPNTSLVTDSPLQKEKKERKEKKEKSQKEQEDLGLATTQPSCEKKGNISYPTKWYQGWSNAKQLGKYLALAIKSLEYLDSKGDLQRNNALFLIACLKVEIEYAKYGHYVLSWGDFQIQQDIILYVANINNSLASPLEDEELAALINSALTNQYHFRKRDTIQRFLNLTDEEFAALGWLDKQRREQEKQERNNALTDLDKDVIKLYLDGLSDAKIAAKLGIPKRQSIRIRQRLGVVDRSVKWENVDFEGNKRHVKHDEPKEDALEMPPVFPYMEWYKPTSKNMYVLDYRTGDYYVKNAVAKRAKIFDGNLALDLTTRIVHNAKNFAEDERRKAEETAREAARAEEARRIEEAEDELDAFFRLD